MFAKLKGTIDSIEEDNLILDVHGVGYLIYGSSSYLVKLNVGQELELFIQTIVKEDAITLYGFCDIQQKKLFNLLMIVQGIGAKIALLLIAKLSVEEIVTAIMLDNNKLFMAIPGIGTKVAQRISTELKDKVDRISITNNRMDATTKSVSNNLNEVMFALEGLGYSRFEVTKVLSELKDKLSSESSSEDIIKECLQWFAKGIN